MRFPVMRFLDGPGRPRGGDPPGRTRFVVRVGPSSYSIAGGRRGEQGAAAGLRAVQPPPASAHGERRRGWRAP